MDQYSIYLSRFPFQKHYIKVDTLVNQRSNEIQIFIQNLFYEIIRLSFLFENFNFVAFLIVVSIGL